MHATEASGFVKYNIYIYISLSPPPPTPPQHVSEEKKSSERGLYFFLGTKYRSINGRRHTHPRERERNSPESGTHERRQCQRFREVRGWSERPETTTVSSYYSIGTPQHHHQFPPPTFFAPLLLPPPPRRGGGWGEEERWRIVVLECGSPFGKGGVHRCHHFVRRLDDGHDVSSSFGNSDSSSLTRIYRCHTSESTIRTLQ